MRERPPAVRVVEFECRRACSEYTVPWLLNFSSSLCPCSDLELELDSQVCDFDYCKWTGDSCETDCYTENIKAHGWGGDAEACRALPDDDKCVWTGDLCPREFWIADDAHASPLVPGPGRRGMRRLA